MRDIIVRDNEHIRVPAMASNDSANVEESSHSGRSFETAVNDGTLSDTTKDEVVQNTTDQPDLSKDIDVPTNPPPPPTSQPMTASDSTSSNPSAKEAVTGPSPYGTRSRNRAGAARPNYAEDKEMELEFEAPVAVKEEDSKRSTRNSESQAALPSQNATQGASLRRGNAAPIDQAASGQNGAKDSIPGTLTFSANPTGSAPPQTLKKQTRKAAPPASTANGSTNSNQSVTRRGSISTQVMNGLRETCMLSFDNCKSKLKDGKLIADDGTMLSVNGMFALSGMPSYSN